LQTNAKKKLSLPQGDLGLAETYSSDRTFSASPKYMRI
jgi:hypothetical protein